MKRITLILTLLLAITIVTAVEYRGIRCGDTEDCVERYGEDWVCVTGQNNHNICIEAEGKMVVPEFTGPALFVMIAVGIGALYMLKKKKG